MAGCTARFHRLGRPDRGNVPQNLRLLTQRAARTKPAAVPASCTPTNSSRKTKLSENVETGLEWNTLGANHSPRPKGRFTPHRSDPWARRRTHTHPGFWGEGALGGGDPEHKDAGDGCRFESQSDGAPLRVSECPATSRIRMTRAPGVGHLRIHEEAVVKTGSETSVGFSRHPFCIILSECVARQRQEMRFGDSYSG